MTTGIVIQARMGSTRLPGKVLMPLPAADHVVALDWTIRACLQTGFPVVVATSTNPEDDAIEAHVRERWIREYHSTPRVDLYRGSAEDVLDRMYQTALQFGFREIVRITGDCPFIDPDVIRQVVALRRNTGCAYASNVDPPSWPDGLDVQVVTMEALKRAWENATAPTERDTVMQYIVTHRAEFSVTNLLCPTPGMQVHRWVLDHHRDYDECSQMAAELLKRGITVPRMIDMLDVAGELGIERHAGRNERYLAARTAELEGEKSFTRNSYRLACTLPVQPYGASTYSKSHVAWGTDGPLYTSHAQGSRVWDIDGNEFIDFTGGLGTTILGHADSDIADAVRSALGNGIASPLAHGHESNVSARLILSVVRDTSEENWKVVWGKNGSDVTSAAVRAARVATGRVDTLSSIVAADHGYHGWHDWALYRTKRGYGVPDCGVVRITDLREVRGSFINTAAIIVEPDQFQPDDLQKLIVRAHLDGALVIFDEMVTFCRYPELTYAATYGLEPDLICVGKCLGNGMPITALIGKAEIMDRFVQHNPAEPYAFYSGTHFGEGLSLAAAETVLMRLDRGSLDRITLHSNLIHQMLATLAMERRIPVKIGVPPLSRLQFEDERHAGMFRREMMHRGVLVYSAFFTMLAHSDADLAHLERAIDGAFRAIADGTARSPRMLADTGIMRS